MDEIEIYDSIYAYQVSENDQIIFDGSPVTVNWFTDEKEMIFVIAYDHEADDEVEFVLDPWQEVNLWMM